MGVAVVLVAKLLLEVFVLPNRLKLREEQLVRDDVDANKGVVVVVVVVIFRLSLLLSAEGSY